MVCDSKNPSIARFCRAISSGLLNRHVALELRLTNMQVLTKKYIDSPKEVILNAAKRLDQRQFEGTNKYAFMIKNKMQFMIVICVSLKLLLVFSTAFA